MSGADTQSNPSDFDFADMQQDLQETEDIDVMKPVTQSIDVNLMMVLNRFPLSEEVVANFGLYQIRYPQLKGLEREDLIKLGVSDNKLQDEMLEEFQLLDGQEPTLRETLSHFRKETLTSQGRHIVDAVQEHLVQINTLLSAITYQLDKTSTSSIVINQQFCSTKLVLDLLSQLQAHASDMENIILALRDTEKLEDYEKKIHERQKKKRVNYFFVIGGIGMLVAGIFFAKRLGMKKLF